MVAAEGIFFLVLLEEPPKIEKADLIAEFEGRVERAQAAYRLADLGYAPAVIISPASRNELDVYDRTYKPRMSFQRVLETKARTTFENALFTSEIIKEKNFKSVILVTSWDHMPRSFMLLRMMLKGSDVRIYRYPVRTGSIFPRKWYRKSLAWKMVYNEVVETWGSLIVFANFRISGEIPRKKPGKNKLFDGLKGLLLFDIDTEVTTSDN